MSRVLSRGRRGVGDGKPVEIPVPPATVIKDGVTQGIRLSARLEMRVQAGRVEHQANPVHRIARAAMGREIKY